MQKEQNIIKNCSIHCLSSKILFSFFHFGFLEIVHCLFFISVSMLENVEIKKNIALKWTHEKNSDYVFFLS